ncbi:MAG: phosphoribosylamine--glycine ligase [Oligoflexia bacterium]|nr:phosphoribosylamine--glycine ligase [Oligoflexia bacterium]
MNMMNLMNILILGSGGREHALYYKIVNDFINIKLKAEAKVKVYVLPGNAGIPEEDRVFLQVDDFEKIKSFAEEKKIDLIIPGSEYPLSLGIVDYFKSSNYSTKVFGPTKEAALLESSKIFAKNFMNKYAIPTARHFSLSGLADVDEAKIINDLNGNLVIKYDGLAQGKGVYVCSSREEANKSLDQMRAMFANNINFIIEEKLFGLELSIITIVDSMSGHYLIFPPARDHKKIGDGDLGANTGGMGALAPIPISEQLLSEIENKIIQPTLEGLKSEGIEYKGFLYFGLMLTANGPYLLEYNVRLGDPEAQVILPLIENNLIDLIEETLDGKLDQRKLKIKIRIKKDKKMLGVVLCSKGYPEKYEIDKEIIFKSNQTQTQNHTIIFHAGTKRVDDKIVTSGGRVMCVVAEGNSFADAREKAYEQCGQIAFDGCYYRKDIGIAQSLKRLKRLAVFISGTGSNLQALHENIINGSLKDLAEIVLVVSNNPDAPGILYARKMSIKTCVVDSRNLSRLQFETIVLSEILPMNLDYIVLAGFMRVLSPFFIQHYKDRIINIHPADPNCYRGNRGYEYAFENKLKETKITVHFVDESVDSGKIILQQDVDLSNVNTLQEIKQYGLSIEHQMYSKALAQVIMNQMV